MAQREWQRTNNVQNVVEIQQEEGDLYGADKIYDDGDEYTGPHYRDWDE